MPKTKRMRDALKPLFLGILNVTEDSFSDGGRFLEPHKAIKHAQDLLAQGADGVDIGAASSHPSALGVSIDEEKARLEPVLDALCLPDRHYLISIDSIHPEIHAYAIAKGCDMLNDVRGYPAAKHYPLLAKSDASLVVMHSLDEAWRASKRSYREDIMGHIERFFDARVSSLEKAGVLRSRLILDPGMGFFLGSNSENSFRALTQLGWLKKHYGCRTLVSVSKKSFLRNSCQRNLHDAGASTLAAEIIAMLQGVDMIRTHAIAPLHDAWTIASQCAKQSSQNALYERKSGTEEMPNPINIS